MAKILIIEDELDIAMVMTEWLSKNDHTVDVSHEGHHAATLMADKRYDLIVLDLGLPGVDGVELLQALRDRGSATPVLVVSGRNTIDAKVNCLELGADDYLTKPFHMRELASRVKVLLRRNWGTASNVLQAGALAINLTTKKVTQASEEVRLTPQEYVLLEFLMKHPNCIFTSRELLDQVWSADDLSTDTVRTCVKRLRQKLGAKEGDSGTQTAIETLPSGYRLNAPEKGN